MSILDQLVIDFDSGPVFENSRFAVFKLEEPIIEEGYSVAQGLNYAIINKNTDIVETYATYQYAAMQVVNQLTEQMDAESPIKKAQVTQLNS